MTRVDGYYLTPGLPENLDRFACKLIEKAFTQGYTIKVRTRDPAHTDALDHLLWTFRDRSFIPHDQTQGQGNPVWITDDNKSFDPPGYRLLIQFHPIPQDEPWLIYERIVEIMDAMTRSTAQNRQRWERYRSENFEVHEHDQSSTE